jgi:hypothetical protein
MGCRVCRARKVRCPLLRPPKENTAPTRWEKLWDVDNQQVKCDGRPNGCRNCERLQLECVADDGSTPNGSGSPGSPMSLRKIRTYRSCQSCRLSKTKCNGDRPKCARCAAKLIQCVYDGGAAPRWTRNLSRSQATSVDEDDGSPTDHDEMSGIAQSEVDENASHRGSWNKMSDEANDKASIVSEAAATSVTGAPSHNGSNGLMSSHPLAW